MLTADQIALDRATAPGRAARLEAENDQLKMLLRLASAQMRKPSLMVRDEFFTPLLAEIDEALDASVSQTGENE